LFSAKPFVSTSVDGPVQSVPTARMSAVFVAYGRRRGKTAPDSKGFYGTSYKKEEVVFAHHAIQLSTDQGDSRKGVLHEYHPGGGQGEVLKTPQLGTNQYRTQIDELRRVT
jgi:hypothetical protein